MKTLKRLMAVMLCMCMAFSTMSMQGSMDGGNSAEAASSIGNVIASINFSDGSVNGSGIRMVNTSDTNAEAYTVADYIGGSYCRKIPSTKYMYLIVDKNIINANDNNLIISVTYYGNNANNLWFNYNSTIADYSGADFTKVKEDAWITTKVVLTNASFRAAQNNNADFRLGFSGSDNYIKEITIAKGALDPDSEPVPAKTGSTISEFTGKSFAGYQVWHQAGNNAGDWVHWAYGNVPAAGYGVKQHILSFPDLSEIYEDSSIAKYATDFAKLGNGKAAMLYNDKDKAVIDRQMNWCAEAGLDGVAIQRFVGGLGRSVTLGETSYLSHIKNACENTGELFYICYDLNGSESDIVKCMKTDWVYEIEQDTSLTSSPNYATVNGKPVVEIWGIGYDMGVSVSQLLDIIHFFQSRGCYVIGGVPNGWRSGVMSFGDCTEVFKALDCVSPWTVGVYNTPSGADNYYNNNMKADYAYCRQNGMDYLPVCFAGSGNWLSQNGSFSHTNREGGKLLWEQVTNAKKLGLTAVYFAMLDEFEESTNLINGAVDYFDIPTDDYFETFSGDGIWVSSDYYLRLAAAASDMLRGEIANTGEIPIAYSNGPIYFRNSFESRTFTMYQNSTYGTFTLPIDACMYKNYQYASSNVSNASVTVEKNAGYAKSGDYALKITGNANNTSAVYEYVTNETKIKVNSGMKLSYSQYALNSNGQKVGVDLIFSDGTKLSDYQQLAVINESGSYMDVEVSFGNTALTGKTITGIALRYNGNASGAFTAYFDNIIVEDGEPKQETPEYTVKYISNGSVMVTQTYKEGSAVTLPDAPVKDGAVFAGWFTENVNLNSAAAVSAARGKAASVSSISSNLTFYAGWINIGNVSRDSNDYVASDSSLSGFDLVGAQLRITEPSGLRFITRISETLISEIEALNNSNTGLKPDSAADKGIGYGTVVTLASNVSDKKLVKDVSATAVAYGMNVCPAVYNFEDYNGYIYYTCVVKNIPKTKYNADIAARPYITYKDANGREQTYYYSESGSASGGYATSITSVSNAIYNLPATNSTIKSWIEKNVF